MSPSTAHKRRLAIVGALGGLWSVSALAMSCYEDWDLVLADASDGVLIRTDSGTSSSETEDTNASNIVLIWLPEGSLRLFEGSNEWKLSVISTPEARIIIGPVSEE